MAVTGLLNPVSNQTDNNAAHNSNCARNETISQPGNNIAYIGKTGHRNQRTQPPENYPAWAACRHKTISPAQSQPGPDVAHNHLRDLSTQRTAHSQPGKSTARCSGRTIKPSAQSQPGRTLHIT